MRAKVDSRAKSSRALPALVIFVLTVFNLLPGGFRGTSSPVDFRPPLAQKVDAVGINVEDLDQSVAFFEKVLTFQKVSETEVAGPDYERFEGVFGLRMRVARLRLGDETIELTEFLSPRGRHVPEDSRSNDRWFQHIAIITSNMDRAYSWLRENKVEHASTGPQLLPSWNKNAGGIRAFYFKDPDGHPLEILQFPADKGAAKWHKQSDRLFLGIDHTAIVVSDTETSLRFYRDTLGMKIVGESENYGEEQERLNNVFGARLRITSLRAADGGPGVEFLEYLSPRDGRPRPADTRANDLIRWQTAMVAPDLDRAAETLDLHAMTLRDGSLGFTSALLVQDPDGHVLRLEQRERQRPQTE